MLKLFQKDKVKENNNLSLIAIACLLIHSAKIDENFTEKERKIIKEALINSKTWYLAIKFRSHQ